MTGETLGLGLCIVAGLLSWWAAVHEGRHQSRLRRHGVHAEGLVVDRERRFSDEPWVPVIEFTDEKGQRARFKPAAQGTGLGFDVGTYVPVVHRPGEPGSARVFTRKHRVEPLVLLWFAGTVFIGGAAVIVLK